MPTYRLIYDAGTITVKKNSAIVAGTHTGWRKELVGRVFRVLGDLPGLTTIQTEYTIVGVDSESQLLTLNNPYQGANKTGTAYLIIHPLWVDYTVATNWQQRYYVIDYEDSDHLTVTTDSAGRPLRKYEVFLPTPDGTFCNGLPLDASVFDPIIYAHIGVSGADDKKHTEDAPKWVTGGWGGRARYGNEGPVGAPAKIFRVHRRPPDPPIAPSDSERVFATPANYHGRSYYTYRWPKPPNGTPLKAHIFRALDDALFKTDWSVRDRKPLLPAGDEAVRKRFFPTDLEYRQMRAASERTQ